MSAVPEKAAPSATPPPADDTSAARATCRCGYTRDHYMVTPEAKHTFWGWCLITLGISSKPIEMTFRCRRCKEVIEVSTDPRDLRVSAR